MTQPAAVEEAKTLEQGAITFLYRPRVEQQHPDALADVQRFLMVLSADGAPFERAIAIGRKRLPSTHRRERFWGFVDLVLTPYDMHNALGAQVYGTRTRGLRHLPAARPFARGTYDLTWHDSHAHFRWHIDSFDRSDPVAELADLERDADTIVTIANPDPAAWGLEEPPDLQSSLFDDLELHVTVPTPFPPALQQRFRNRRFVQLDSTEWLDYPGAEIVFLGAGD